jgi:urease accessory protein
MRAYARIVAEADGHGGTRLAVLRGEPPLLPRRTGPPGLSYAEVHLVGGAAGPLGGDDLHLDVEVGPGAHLVVRTVAASLLLPGRGRSRTVVQAHVEGRLDWVPEQLIAAVSCDHLAQSTVDLSESARLVWREEIVCGRHGEACGDLRVSTTVRRGGAPLLRQDLAVGPRADEWAGPAVLAGSRAAGSLLVVDPSAAPEPARMLNAEGVRAARLPLTGPAHLVTAVATSAHALRSALVTAVAPSAHALPTAFVAA